MGRGLGQRDALDRILVARTELALTTLFELLAAAAGAGVIAPGFGDRPFQRRAAGQEGLRYWAVRD